MTHRSLLLASALAILPAAGHAEWALDPAHTSVLVTVGHLGFSDVTVAFREFEADVTFDPEAIEATDVTFTIAAASVDSFWPERTAHLRTADFLDVESHPEITFVSTEVTSTGEDTATVAGDLTIRGTTRPVTFDATLNQVGPNPFMPDQEIAGFTLTGAIDRTEFGVDFGAPVISAVLPVTINVELTRTN